METNENTPSYLMAADTHSMLNGGKDDSLFSAASDIVTKFIPTAIASGINELYNIGPTVGNFFGGNFEQSDLRRQLTALDNDLALYYDDHKLGADTVGFILGSVLPGTGGMKVLNAGQRMLRGAFIEGSMGTFTGNALGILAPNRDVYLAEALSSIKSSGSVFSLMETNTLKTLGAGFSQNALEGAAFELAVAATMNKSPILDEQSHSDLFWNVMTGAGVNGVLGGIFSGAVKGWQIAKAGRTAQLELAPWTITEGTTAGMSASDKIVSYMKQLNEMPAAMAEGELAGRSKLMFDKKTTSLTDSIRTEILALAKEDNELAQAFHSMTLGKNLQTNASMIMDSVAVARIGTTSGVEAAMKSAAKKIAKAGPDGPNLTVEEMDAVHNTKVSFLRLRGEGAGEVLDSRPASLSIFDRATAEQVVASEKGVKIKNQFFKQENNPHVQVNALSMGPDGYEIRQVWAEKLPRWEPDFIPQIHADDIPLLDKAIRDGVESLSVIPESGLIKEATTISGKAALIEFKKQRAVEIGMKLLSRPKDVTISPTVRADKLRAALGIDFEIVDDAAANYNGFFTRIRGKVAAETAGAELDVVGQVIAIERNAMDNLSARRLVSTLKHEQGHAIFNSLLRKNSVSLSNLTSKFPQLAKEVQEISQRARPGALAKYPSAERIHEAFADAFGYLAIHPKLLDKYPEVKAFAGHLIQPVDENVLASLSVRAAKLSQEDIAQMLNVTNDALSGTFKEGWHDARALARAEYKADMLKKGVRESEIPDAMTLPSVAKVITKKSGLNDADGNELGGIALLAQKSKLAQEAADRTAADVLSAIEPGIVMPNIPDEIILTGSAGPTLLGFTQGGLHTMQSVMEFVGQRTHALGLKAVAAAHDLFSPQVSKLMADLDGAIEFSVVNEKLRNLPGKYKFDRASSSFKFKGTDAEIAEAVGHNWPVEIPVKNAATADLIANHISRNSEYLRAKGLIRSNEGLPNRIDSEVYYPIPRSPKNTPFFAMVIDDSVTGTGHSKMIYADTAAHLETLKNEVMKAGEGKYTVLTKDESANYFKSRGQYEYERSLNENYINNELARKGVSSSFLPQTDPKVILEDFIGWHTSRSRNMVREAISHKYERQFTALMQAEENSLQAAKSKFGYSGPTAYAENAVNNPASNLIKLALDIQKIEEYPVWSSLNKMLDSKTSELTAKISRLWEGATSKEHLGKINEALDKAGMGHVFPEGISPVLYEAMNGKVPRNVLTQFIGQANGLISTFALRLDPFNAMNNLIGAQVLLGTETSSLIKAIKNGNEEAAGELTKLLKIGVPGTDSMISSPTKLIANAIARFHQNPVLDAVMGLGLNKGFAQGGTKPLTLREFYKQHGFQSSISDQYHQVIDEVGASLARDGNISNAFTKMKEWANKGEALTGNRVAEEFNRFIAADVMKQLTDVAVKHGIISDDIALTYINTFVNRTQGNFLASQRPLLFQGPVGQAIGLFQTYQFNLIQQMLRHVGEGQAKSAATMMALQGTIYGMNGLPAFNAINTHIIGNASGNREHTDLVNVGYSAAGKVAGDWLMYGAASNALSIFHPDLKNNMYSRGDVNPRSLTIVPSSLEDVPIVKGAARLYSNMENMFKQTANGAPVWETFLRGIEHNGISRPLAGMAQVMEAVGSGREKVVATNTHLNQTMSHDLYSLASLVRIAGAKPLDESIVNDMMFRFNAYDRNDKAHNATLGEAIKMKVFGGGDISPELIEDFTHQYVKNGGKQENFAKFMASQYRNANTSQANQLKGALENPKVQQYQQLMGGMKLEDSSQ